MPVFNGMVSFPDELGHAWAPPGPTQRFPGARQQLLPTRLRAARVCAHLPGSLAFARAPCPRFRTASLKKTSRVPGCQARSIKAAGVLRRKRPVCVRETQKPFSRHRDSRGRGRGLGNCALTVWVVRLWVPRQDKRASVPERRPPGGLVGA